MKRRPLAPVAAQRGGLLIEVLVALVLCAFSLLGFVALQARASTAEFEALQRSQALVLVEDMASRINANRANAGNYPRANLIGSGSVQDCAGLAGADLDICDWANRLRGAGEITGGASVGAMVGARGCITLAAGTTNRYIISVAWLGVAPTGSPTAPCGRGSTDFANDTLRRVVSATVCVGQLRDPAVAPATQRC